MSDTPATLEPKDPFVSRGGDSLRSLLASILASVPDAMIVIDQRGEIIAFSAEAEKLFGYASVDVIGRNVSLLMTEKDRSHHDRYMDHYMATGEKQIIGIGRVVDARLADGRSIPVDLKIGEAKLGAKRLFTGYIRDVSAQREAELRMQEMQSELANFSRLSAVGTMASAMAHELNQPLTAVTNYLEAVRDLLDHPDADTIKIIQDALNQASIQSVRAGQIVRRLRDYVSRGEIETRATPLAPLINDAISLARIGLDGQLPRITEQIDPGLGDVLADRVQIRQVVINLVRNAIEAMATAPDARIWITARQTNGDDVLVGVRDNGPGFGNGPADSEIHPFRTSKPTGMGLGLSICQTIVEGHGGKLWIEPTTEGGADVRFTLKLVQSTQA